MDVCPGCCACRRTHESCRVIRRQIADVRQEPVLVGLDCEMCATRDDDRELLGLCLIDADGEVLVQVRRALVFPAETAALPRPVRSSQRRSVPAAKHLRACRAATRHHPASLYLYLIRHKSHTTEQSSRYQPGQL